MNNKWVAKAFLAIAVIITALPTSSFSQIWDAPPRRMETYTGTTNGSGDYTVVYIFPFPTTPHVNPVTYPSADATTRVRVTASDANGFTVHAEKNGGITVLTFDVLGLATAAMPSIPIRVFVVQQ